jgi:hypothetical protein
MQLVAPHPSPGGRPADVPTCRPAWKASTRQVTVTGIPSAARSRTSGYLIFVDRSRATNAAARRRISFSCSSTLSRRRSSRDSPLVTAGRRPSSISAIFSYRCRHDSEIAKSFAICDSGASPLRATAITSRRNSTGERLRRSQHPSSEDQILAGMESAEPLGKSRLLQGARAGPIWEPTAVCVTAASACALG